MTLAMASVRPCTSWLIVNDHSFDYNFRGFFGGDFYKVSLSQANLLTCHYLPKFVSPLVFLHERL